MAWDCDGEKMRRTPSSIRRAAQDTTLARPIVLNSRHRISGAGHKYLYNLGNLDGWRASNKSALAFAGCIRSGAGASFLEATPCP
jgi:hypothetical protein